MIASARAGEYALPLDEGRVYLPERVSKGLRPEPPWAVGELLEERG